MGQFKGCGKDRGGMKDAFLFGLAGRIANLYRKTRS